VCGIETAHSFEFDKESPDPVICLMDSQLNVTTKGGTMRLGAYPCELTPGSLAHEIYGVPVVHERHRHRYEFNQAFENQLTEAGLRFSGRTPDGKFVEIAEIPDHPWYIAVQYHPEFKSRPLPPHPLFREFVKAAASYREDQKTSAQAETKMA